jgi:hypothetical protein
MLFNDSVASTNAYSAGQSLLPHSTNADNFCSDCRDPSSLNAG